MSFDSLQGGLALARLVHLASLALLFGALLFPWYTGARPAARTAGLVVAAMLALAAGLLWFAFTAAGMAGQLSAAWDGAVLAQVLNETDFGRVWVLRLAAIAVLVPLAASRSNAGRAFALALCAAALASLAFTGHANEEEGRLGLLHKAADGLHLLTAGLWLGALPALARVLSRASAEEAYRTVRSFSRWAMAAVVLLIGTGAINAALILGSPADLALSAYGQLLLLKLLLVTGMLALAGFNQRRLTPALAGAGGASAAARLRRHCWLELSLGVGVVAVVALLGITPPD